MEFEKLLRLMVERSASDLFITAGIPPSMKINGKVVPVDQTPLSPEVTRETVFGVMNDHQRREFAEKHECNFAISAGRRALSGQRVLSAQHGGYGVAAY